MRKNRPEHGEQPGGEGQDDVDLLGLGQQDGGLVDVAILLDGRGHRTMGLRGRAVEGSDQMLCGLARSR